MNRSSAAPGRVGIAAGGTGRPGRRRGRPPGCRPASSERGAPLRPRGPPSAASSCPADTAFGPCGAPWSPPPAAPRGTPLRGAPLPGAPLPGAPFSGAPLPGAPLRGTPLAEVSLRGAPLGGASWRSAPSGRNSSCTAPPTGRAAPRSPCATPFVPCDPLPFSGRAPGRRDCACGSHPVPGSRCGPRAPCGSPGSAKGCADGGCGDEGCAEGGCVEGGCAGALNRSEPDGVSAGQAGRPPVPPAPSGPPKTTPSGRTSWGPGARPPMVGRRPGSRPEPVPSFPPV
ncbi:hypothetical protein FVA95_02495 [Pseudonocardia sp. EV170527-09]|nr:hypothetical protein FVA95_02495 [Pseudonocardia sp. EV170527-09]